MDHFQRLRNQVGNYLILLLAGQLVLVAVVVWALLSLGIEKPLTVASIVVAVGIVIGYAVTLLTLRYALRPLQLVWQAVLHVSAGQNITPAPNLETVQAGRELVNAMVLQIYQFASQQNGSELIEHRNQVIQAANIVSHMPLPLFVMNKDQVVTNASTAAMEYCGLESAQLFGHALFEAVNMEFDTEQTLEQWMKDCQEQKVTDTAHWEHVRVRLGGEAGLRQCDMAAYYNRDNPSGTEFIVTLFDRTEKYSQEDQSLSFVALAVHELRTPLTVLRGYIEVFEDELGDKLDPELKDFMHKMQLSSQQLSAFVNNILNVARIDENQLALHLNEEDWADILRKACADMEMRARIHGMSIEYDIADNLPAVGVDRVSISEVIYNLLDNAVKYSGSSGKRILVSAKLNNDGLVETTVQDFGVGIPSGVLPHLFSKFYRNHRTKSQVGGTGLGLFLCKSIVTAHGGNIWVRSKTDEGSSFSFTLQPYAQLAEEQKTGNNSDIVRQAHGWIKNHSLYRR